MRHAERASISLLSRTLMPPRTSPYRTLVPIPQGPSTQIVGFQGPKTIHSMDFGTSNLTIWVLGPSGYSTNIQVKSSAKLQPHLSLGGERCGRAPQDQRRGYLSQTAVWGLGLFRV